MMRRRSSKPFGRSTAAGTVALALAAPGLPAALAQGAELGAATCAQFNGLNSAESSQLALWLHGYYAGAAQRPALDRRQLQQAVADLQAACRDNPALPLLGEQSGAIMRGTAKAPEAGNAAPEAGSEPGRGAAPSPLPGAAPRPAPAQ